MKTYPHPPLTPYPHSTLNPPQDSEEANSEPTTPSPALLSALLSLPTLPSLTSTTLRFSPHGSRAWDYPSERSRWNLEWPQDSTYRHTLLTTLFTALTSLPTLTALHLDNLLNTTTPSATAPSPLVAPAVLSRLTTLHLSIITESDDAAPEHEIYDPRLHEFIASLPTTILSPDCTSNLRTLALYQTTFHFGFAPKLDLRGVHFPRLKTLALGNYTFTHDWQLEWLRGHRGTLEELYLDDCIVVYYAKMGGLGVDGEGYPVFDGPEGQGGGDEFRFYEMTWARILGYIAREMAGGKGLRKVMVGSSPRWDGWTPRKWTVEEDEGAQKRYAGREWEEVAVGMFKGNYCIFDMGIGPYQFTDGGRPGPGIKMEAYDGGETEAGRRCVEFWGRIGKQEKEDVVALRSLLGKLGQQVEETWEDDVIKVEGLMGRRNW